jgi:ABC-type glycerol-3-phosphate transport system permease component
MTKTPKVKTNKKLNRMTPMKSIGIVLLCAISLIYLYPLLWQADSAFRPAVDIFQTPPVLFQDTAKAISEYTLESFRTALGDWNVGWAFLMSVLITFAGIALTLVVCSLSAYAFAYLDFPGKGFLFMVVLGSMMLPMGTMIAPSYKVIRTLGLTNNPLGLILPYAVSAFGVFLLRQYYIKIPRALIESAKIDGANHVRIWWNIILPLSKPALAALAIFQFRTIWNDFLMPMIILRSEIFFTLPVRIQVMDSQNFNKPYDAIIATGFITAIVPTIVFLVFQRQFIEGLAGGVKE